MISKDTTFTAQEIGAATGIPYKTICARAKVLRERGEFPPIKPRTTAFYTYDQVIKLIRRPQRKIATGIRKSHVALLQRQLQTDGHQINKGKETKEATA